MNQFYKLNAFIILPFMLIACGNDVPPPKVIESSEVEVSEDIIDEEQPEIDYEAQQVDETMANIETFANAVLNDDVATVLSYIEFPFHRTAPKSAIMNATEFEAYYPTLFDAELKENIQAYLDEPDIIDLSSSNGTIGILNGLIWFNDPASKIVSMNYQSEAEKEDLAEMEQELRNAMHPILKDYTYNVFLGRTEDGLFRIDETEKGLRYASWYGDQNMLDEPDFILWNGVSEKQGTAGGWTTTFDRVDTKYILDQVDMCEDPEDCGLFLVVEDEGEITSKLVVEEILNPFDELKERTDKDKSLD